MVRQITYEMCKTMTDFLVRRGEEMGKPLAIVITDDGGSVVSATLMDGFHVRGVQFAYHKAYTSAKMTRTGREVRELCAKDGNDVSVFCDPNMTTLIGSTPIRNGKGDVIGAVGVSGATSDEDQELCDLAAELARGGPCAI